LEVSGLAAAEIETSLHQYSTPFQESRARVSKLVIQSLLRKRWINLRWRGGGFAGRDARKATTRMVRPRRAEQCLPKGRCDPVAGCLRPNKTVVRSKHPFRYPIPALRGPSGHAPGSHGVCAPWHRSPNSTCVAHLMIIPILPATRSARICSALP